jgi:hypothetical protein
MKPYFSNDTLLIATRRSSSLFNPPINDGIRRNDFEFRNISILLRLELTNDEPVSTIHNCRPFSRISIAVIFPSNEMTYNT